MHLTNRTKIEILRAVFNSFSTVIVAEVNLEVTVQMQMSLLSGCVANVSYVLK